jgi:hypothetical protein
VALGTREFQLKFVPLPLTRLVGHRVAVTGLLIGEGGVGVNVNSVDNVADTCNTQTVNSQVSTRLSTAET